MSANPFPRTEAKVRLKKIKDRRQGMRNQRPVRTEYSSEEYERDLHELLEAMFPYSVLSGLRLFSAETRGYRDHGFELDNVMHLRVSGTDYIVVIEAKKPSVNAEGGRWPILYADGPKCAKRQVDNHVRTLWEYLRPIAQGLDLKFIAIVCTLESSKKVSSDGYRNADLNVVGIDDLFEFLANKFSFGGASEATAPEVLRVSQSTFLSMLRLGVPVPALGHPEVSGAVRYVERCRRALDAALFSDFTPKSERWAINGSAGMGKSVLLAYSAAVLASGREWQGEPGEEYAQPSLILKSIGYSPDESSGPIYVVAMTTKQREQLQKFYREFVRRFQAGDYRGQITFRRVEFVVCRDAHKVSTWCDEASAFLVDEAHDLPAYAAKEISEKHASKGFYLILAYDSHQKLRLTQSDSGILDGVDFRRKTDRLRQIYRNPLPIYMASLALMFRWMGVDGPKVIPTKKDLERDFAFDVKDDGDGELEISMKTDAHPANAWTHTVATFPDAETAFKSLENDRMGFTEVLWVRFCEEDPEFDYERLRRFTYHNCRNYDSDMMSDKYVKGQEYPIVVIEGFPGFMDRYEDSEDGTADEGKMWKFRREVYLCASRATCFLYFVCNPRHFTKENGRIVTELSKLVASLAVPAEAVRGRTRTWSLTIKKTAQSRSLTQIDDAILNRKPILARGDTSEEPNALLEVAPLPADVKTSRAELDVFALQEPVTPKVLASALGVKPFTIIKELMELGVFANISQALDKDQIAAVCRARGYAPQELNVEAEIKLPLEPIPENTESKKPDPAVITEAPLSTEQGFEYFITIEKPLSALELAGMLGRKKRDIIAEAQRINIPVRSADRLGLHAIQRIAAVFGFAVRTK